MPAAFRAGWKCCWASMHVLRFSSVKTQPVSSSQVPSGRHRSWKTQEQGRGLRAQPSFPSRVLTSLLRAPFTSSVLSWRTWAAPTPGVWLAQEAQGWVWAPHQLLTVSVRGPDQFAVWLRHFTRTPRQHLLLECPGSGHSVQLWSCARAPGASFPHCQGTTGRLTAGGLLVLSLLSLQERGSATQLVDTVVPSPAASLTWLCCSPLPACDLTFQSARSLLPGGPHLLSGSGTAAQLTPGAGRGQNTGGDQERRAQPDVCCLSPSLRHALACFHHVDHRGHCGGDTAGDTHTGSEASWE